MNIKARQLASVRPPPDDIYEEPLPELENEPEEAKLSDLSEPKKKTTTMKVIVWICLLNGLSWVWCSYILAWMGREQIAESLSKVALTEIIGVVLVYAAKSVVENLSKNNAWPDQSGLNRVSDAGQDRLITTMKAIVLVCLLNGFAWVWCSYILAWQGKEQIAESLSQVAITEIIGVVLVYAVKSIFENLSKNNSWPDKPSKDPPDEGW